MGVIGTLVVPRLAGWGLKIAAGLAATWLAAYANAQTLEPYRSVCVVQVPGSRGSGALIGVNPEGQGLVLTCRHVAEEKGSRVVVRWPWSKDSHVSQGTVVEVLGGSDAATDLALIRTDSAPPDIRPLVIHKFNPREGFWVGAGFWRASSDDPLMMHITRPITQASESRGGMITFNVPIYPGLSGGPLFNYRGQVVGVLVLSDRQTFGVATNGAHLHGMVSKYLPITSVPQGG